MEKSTYLVPFSGKMCRNKEPVRPVETSCRLVICESYLHDPELPGLGLIAQFGLLPLWLAPFGHGGHENNALLPLQIRSRGSKMERKATGQINQQNDQFDAAWEMQPTQIWGDRFI